jgi:Heme NO binding associated
MEKTKQMEDSMQKLDEEMRRSDMLLAQMMPKSVSDKVKLNNNYEGRHFCSIYKPKRVLHIRTIFVGIRI